MPNYKDFDLDIQKKQDSCNLKDDSNKDKLMWGRTDGCYTYGNRSCPNTICAY